MPMTWNDQTDAKLLLAIITKSETKINYNAIAEYMGCTPVAAQHRVQRLRERAKENLVGSEDAANGATEGDAGASTPAAPVTHVTPVTPVTPEKRKRGRPKKVVAAVGEDGNVNTADGGEEGGSPAKKGRVAKGKGKGKGKVKVADLGVVKVEDEDQGLGGVDGCVGGDDDGDGDGDEDEDEDVKMEGVGVDVE
ncbi:hypothetical protein BDW59DRAFT_164104 [Aspergillus cavernicola]|uniref:Myb-like DNA-binding domain-containing protein n=1 Tax=Aspergillus cavernicola TaxID=176166 RepID=A0ABR4I1Z5_9EURO